VVVGRTSLEGLAFAKFRQERDGLFTPRDGRS
jgi:hypothetical protein